MVDSSFFLFLLLRLETFRIEWPTLVWKSNVLVDPTPQVDHLAAFAAKRRCISFVQKKHSSTGTAGQPAWIVTQSLSSVFHMRTSENCGTAALRHPTVTTQMVINRVHGWCSLWHVKGNRNTTFVDGPSPLRMVRCQRSAPAERRPSFDAR